MSEIPVKTSMDLVEFMSRLTLCSTSDVFQPTVSKDNIDDFRRHHLNRKSYEFHYRSIDRRRRSIDRRRRSFESRSRSIDRRRRSSESHRRSIDRRRRSSKSRRSIDRRCRSSESRRRTRRSTESRRRYIGRHWERINRLSRTIYHCIRTRHHPYSKNADCHQRIRINHHRRSVGDHWNSHHNPLKKINGL